ncbi:hypothetical protein [Altererythrobacter sp. BO-6]|uniref:hypothetical protein n=1 Tax=Altererythrobacter sp. BO-6 TaxID=2604537 RepID=UPI0019CF4D15|nr:hypothetical protein [Altererythrobacter sp. BO-6]
MVATSPPKPGGHASLANAAAHCGAAGKAGISSRCNHWREAREPAGDAAMTAKNTRKENIMQNIAEKLFSLIAAISLSGLMFNAVIV